jgi:hypothetical protein
MRREVDIEQQRWLRVPFGFRHPRYGGTARGNNDRLSTPWREMISLADVAASISRHRRAELAVSRSARQSAWREGSEYD